MICDAWQREEVRRKNGAEGISDIEGKIARVATSELGNERVSMVCVIRATQELRAGLALVVR